MAERAGVAYRAADHLDPERVEIAAAIKFGLGRVAKSFDAMGVKFDAMASKHEGEERALIKLEGTDREPRRQRANARRRP